MLRFGILFIGLLITPTLVGAQFNNLSNNINIESSPRFPEPRETVVLTLNAYSIDTNGSSITWLVDGVELTDKNNERSITVIAGEIGVIKNISAIISKAGTVNTITHRLKPTRIDTYIEADSLVPTFYKGRALPSIGSNIRVTALPFTGETIAPNEYAYLWRLNNKVLYGGSVLGKQTAEFKAPKARESILSVDVISQNAVSYTHLTLPTTSPV